MKELGSEVGGGSEDSQKTRSSAQEIDTRFLLGCESTSLSAERLDKDKNTDENVDADRVRTERPVGCDNPVSSHS